MSSPTPEQINTVRANLAIMNDLTTTIYPHVVALIENAYLLLSESDSADPGLTIVVDFMEGAFGTAASELGPAGKVAASFLSGVIDRWTADPPSTLNAQFSSYLTRYDKSSLALNMQLDTIREDLVSSNPDTVDAAWNAQFACNGRIWTADDLASIQLPNKLEPEFDAMVTSTEFAHDQALWTQMLQANYYVPFYQYYNLQTESKSPPWDWAQPRLESWPYCFYAFELDSVADPHIVLWVADEYVVCKQNTIAWHYLNDDACHYLFIDGIPGTTINPDGLFTRKQVVDFLGIQYVKNRRGEAQDPQSHNEPQFPNTPQ